ncbi:ABC transporter permease [Celeribacter halophilus]|jgi:NitT/TauT family transport system permease protein/sulfonate transport system permease protein|uniref:ABC transporter permease n=1 Tax=Celeribacter halophilus TaxID=576117 RepID=A0AAW7XWI0_9RHOB|nr:ABC transporter permease [Celeribacter halophilus]MDO6457005.1 ABC transporter permease [Celeribacter halophilus]MDO6723667.1 ABC transporter permease [Celeribacter halophilus]
MTIQTTTAPPPHQVKTKRTIGPAARRKLTLNAIGLLGTLLLWQALAGLGIINSFLLPAPTDVLAALAALSKDGTLFVHLAASLKRVVLGYLLACAIGLPLGFLCGWSRTAADLIRPIIEALRPVPPLAWVPISILWFGLGDMSAYFLVFLGCVFPLFFGAYTAVRSIDRNQINAALCLGAPRNMLFLEVLFPAALPIMMPNLRLALGIGWMCVVTAELIAAQTGLGYLIQQSRMLFQINNVVAGMVAIGVVGFIMSAAVEKIERRVNAWSPSERS